MSSDVSLPAKLFIDICTTLGYDPDRVVSMRINHRRVTIVYTEGTSQEASVARHKLTWE